MVERENCNIDSGKNSVLDKPSAIERTSGSLPMEATLSFISALSGTPLTALLPILSNTLAASRHKNRIEEAIQNINHILNEHTETLNTLTDSQYKLVNEAILAILHTTNDEKISYLRQIIQTSLYSSELDSQDAIVLGRIIRDISADEASFLLKNFGYQRVQFSYTPEKESDPTLLSVSPETREGLIVSGLISLGILTSTSPVIGDVGKFRFSRIGGTLLTLLKNPPSAHS